VKNVEIVFTSKQYISLNVHLKALMWIVKKQKTFGLWRKFALQKL
jgi:hypothetical protein